MYPEYCVAQRQQPYPLHKITQSYNPVVQNEPRPRQPNENPKDYMITAYTSINHVIDISPTSSIYRLDPFAKYLCCWTNTVGSEEVSAIQERTKWKHPNLVSFLFFEEQSDKFSQSKQLKIFYEYLPLDIRQLIEKRSKTQEYVPEEEIWKMISGLCEAFVFLQKRGITHSALTLESVYFDEEYLLYRIQDVSPFRARAPHLFENQYKSPESGGNLRVNRFKQDVFGLGMIILSLCLLKNCDYLFETGSIGVIQLNDCFDQLKSLYPGRVDSILKKMLLIDFNQRPDWLEMQQLLGNLKEMQLTNLDLGLSNKSSILNSSFQLQQQQQQQQQVYKAYDQLTLSQENREISNNNNKFTSSINNNTTIKTTSTDSVDQKLINLNKRIQETLSKSLNKNIR
ncbi:unnamed protein product [Paramecium octaurelia]|uniref:Protein kinase domain-containing protein n=1 Tax=Paramecium octaurelia TaxID=43137 RepID=A0A8S1USL8_PAROT|nr:unnamed protein product [Paramecium octaurelia]